MRYAYAYDHPNDPDTVSVRDTPEFSDALDELMGNVAGLLPLIDALDSYMAKNGDAADREMADAIRDTVGERVWSYRQDAADGMDDGNGMDADLFGKPVELIADAIAARTRAAARIKRLRDAQVTRHVAEVVASCGIAANRAQPTEWR